MRHEVLQFELKKHVRPAVLTRTNYEKGALAILLGGSGDHGVDGWVGPNPFLLQLAEGLAVRGVQTLRFAKLGPGDGREVETLVDEYIEPALRLAEVIKSEYKMHAIALVGHSLGGHVAPEIAGRLKDISKIVLLNAPFSNIIEVLKWQLKNLSHLHDCDRRTLATLVRNVSQSFGPDLLKSSLERYLWHAMRYSPEIWLGKSSASYLILSCGRDAQVPEIEVEFWSAAALAHGAPHKSQVFPNLNHLAMRTDVTAAETALRRNSIDNEVLDSIANWIVGQ